MNRKLHIKHDCDARKDEGLVALRIKHGWAGYGIYWALLERLCESSDYTCVKVYDVVAFDLRADANIIQSIVEDFGLFAFSEDGKRFYSPRLIDEVQAAQVISQQRRKAVNKRWEKDKRGKLPINATSNSQINRISDTNVLQMQYKSNTNEIQDNTLFQSTKASQYHENDMCELHIGRENDTNVIQVNYKSNTSVIQEEKERKQEKETGLPHTPSTKEKEINKEKESRCNARAREEAAEAEAAEERASSMVLASPPADPLAPFGALSTSPPAVVAPTQDGAYISQIGRPQVGIGFIPQLWNECCPSFPEVSQLSPSRCTHLLDRIRRDGITTSKAAQSLFRSVFERVERSDFLTGRLGTSSWKATFDWVIIPDNWTKIVDGNYDNRHPASHPNQHLLSLRSPTALDTSKMNYSAKI